MKSAIVTCRKVHQMIEALKNTGLQISVQESKELFVPKEKIHLLIIQDVDHPEKIVKFFQEADKAQVVLCQGQLYGEGRFEVTKNPEGIGKGNPLEANIKRITQSFDSMESFRHLVFSPSCPVEDRVTKILRVLNLNHSIQNKASQVA